MDYSRPSSFTDYGIIVPAGKTGNGVRCECPQCSPDHRKRSLTLSVDTDRGLFHCFRCRWSGRLNGEASIVPIDPFRRAQEEKKKLRQADRARHQLTNVLQESYPIDYPYSKVVLDYLANRLAGHALPKLPNDLRCHKSLAYFDTEINKLTGHYQAMLGTIRNVHGERITFHRTYLTKEGEKADVGSPKKLMPPPWPKTVTGGAIQLYKPTDTLILAEGIETALALTVALDEPCWASISAHGLARVEVPDGVRTVIIGADRDKSGTGQKAALVLKKRMSLEGINSRVMLPDTVGQDWLDILIRE